MQSERQPETVETTREQTPKQPRQTAQTSKPAQTSQPKQEPAKAPEKTGFSAYLVDEYGEIAGDEITNAMDFARALVNLVKSADNKGAVLEHNAAGIEDASVANSAARKMIADILPGDEEPSETEAPVLTAISRFRRTGVAQAGHSTSRRQRSRCSASSLTSLASGCRSTWPTITQAPAAQRLLLVQAITAKAKSDRPAYTSRGQCAHRSPAGIYRHCRSRREVGQRHHR